ncbi:uncharacterized protein isoform X2 [Leptinotarsa decemlineata]|uniref:uncharacterized protein isoform X2 n=1 Tax=Leptinotarsa decemlineata TaxID=7539 RepID=UPI000C253C0E|nr:uncharacterized protein LOC111506596 isoform X2 [Leptinotarsa decemlineata]
MDIQQLLNLWKADDIIISKFLDNKVTVEDLPFLTEEYLKELVPLIGQRIMIKKKIHDYIVSQKENIAENIINKSPKPHELIQIINEFSDIQTTSTISHCSTEPSSLPADSSFHVDEYFGDNLDLIIRPKFSDFDLKTILQTSPMGNSVLKYYETKKQLDGTRRTRLVDIIMKHLYNHIIKQRLSHDEYTILAAKIVQLFPTETTGIYYIPAIKKRHSVTGKSIVAKGRLVDKCRNIIYKCDDAITLKSRKRKSSWNSTENIPEKEATDTVAELQDDQNYIWLLHNSDPWTTVENKWDLLYDKRREQKCESAAEFLKLWSVLTDPRGISLIAKDFERLYPSSSMSFYVKWEPFFESVLEYKKNIAVDKLLVSLIEEIESTENTDVKLIKQISLLPQLIPPRGRVKLNNKTWKFSTVECQEGFLVHVTSVSEIEEKLKNLRDQAAAKKTTLQPFILIEGPYDCPSNFYIIIDKIRYHFKSIVPCFDTLFKIFHVLDIKYPAQCEYLWVLIQKCVFNIDTKFDNVPPYLSDILHISRQ